MFDRSIISFQPSYGRWCDGPVGHGGGMWWAGAGILTPHIPV